ncbi:MAG: cbb3-type cytochrome c oxidase subunit I [Gammaproteobacteria bacterium]|nr:cbb3-type cytochrome c oxidase subunit I [Gammaproteobacteria bacterium]
MIPEADYIIPVDGEPQKALARGWLWLGVLSLLGSGVFSILLVLARTPAVNEWIPWVDFFHIALVVHVDLSVLVWFAAFSGLMWTLNSTKKQLALGWAGLAAAALGTLMMAVSPFLGAGDPLMSNYVPVLQDQLFYAALLIFAAGMCLVVIRSMIAIAPVGRYMTGVGAQRFGMNTLTVSAVMALVAFVWTWWLLPDFLEGRAYFELLFWGGGHVLQFTWTLLLIIAWLWLASESGMSLPLTPRVTLIFFGFGLFAVFLTPPIYMAYDITSVDHIKVFTWLMRYGGSLASLPLGLAVCYGLLISKSCSEQEKPYRSALISSLILFGAGGLIGFFISGADVTIPAHYHGSIVGVTLGLMGLTYMLLPRLGYGIARIKWANVQPWLYGGGQLLHVLGLMWSGGYGVQRKVAGADQVLDGLEKQIAMGVMGLGGLIAIIGGIVFVYIVLEAMLKKPSA